MYSFLSKLGVFCLVFCVIPEGIFSQTQRFKRVDYEYDLISGNVQKVSYQKDSVDAWHHKYEYDGDNRIVRAYTSSDDITYDQDAGYIYYDHGPLARMEAGEHNVQGTDYAYTLQGWLKGVNADIVSPDKDMGHDGDGQSNNPNANFAMDAMGYSLSYYQGDYSPIDTSVWNDTTQRFIAHYDGSDVDSTANDLYNGNIRHMVTTITKPQVYSDTANITPVILPQATTYEYDQLNRLIGAQAYQNLYAAGNYWQRDNNYSGQYENRFKYDANGNILSQLRKNALGAVIDSLNYRYHLDQNGDRVQNRLYHVQDSTSSGTYSDDIDDMGAFTASANNINDGSNNYSYDDIGQLIKDSQEEIDSILWRVDGKVKAIHRSSGSNKKELAFEYDAMGNRIAKHQYETATGLSFGSWEKSTYYSRDAQGNVMAVYEYTIEDMVSSYKLKERNIYGSSRVGVYTDTIEMIGSSVDTNHYYHRIGDRYYECSNHLGNVLAVISDKRIPVDDYEVDNPFTIGGDSSGYNNWTAVGSPTISLDGDKLKVVTSSNNHGVEQHYGTTAGGQYRFTLDIDHGATSQKLWVYIKDKSSGVNLSERSYGGSVSGDVNIEFYAKGDSTTVQVLRRANGTYWKMDDAVFTRTNYVPINSDFESNQYSTADYQRWEPSSLTTVTRDSGRLKAETTNKYHSVSRFFGAHPGHQYQIDFDLEIGTMNKVTIFCLEYTSFSTKTTEYYTTRTSDDHLSFTVDAHATLHSNMRFYVARDDANGASKHFFLDNVTITDLTEENEGGQLGIPITAAAYPDVIQSGDYSPFGVQLDQRTFALDTTDTTGYRYGFNGMELDNEVKNGNGNHLDFGARCYDSRLGRWLSLDPLAHKQPGWSPYKAMRNSPILFNDPDGREEFITITIDNKKTGAYTQIKIKVSNDLHTHMRKSESLRFDYYDINHELTITIPKDGSKTTSDYRWDLYDKKRYTSLFRSEWWARNAIDPSPEFMLVSKSGEGKDIRRTTYDVNIINADELLALLKGMSGNPGKMPNSMLSTVTSVLKQAKKLSGTKKHVDNLTSAVQDLYDYATQSNESQSDANNSPINNNNSSVSRDSDDVVVGKSATIEGDSATINARDGKTYKAKTEDYMKGKGVVQKTKTIETKKQ